MAVLRGWSKLSEGERNRISLARMDALKQCTDRGVRVWTMPQYHVGNPDDFPLALFVDGDETCLNGPTLGIVGTRRASNYGLAAAQKFAEKMALAGVTIVSGGAAGIDTAAHRGALNVGGKTAAIFGCGVDVVFPVANQAIFQEISRSGCLLSQFPCGMHTNEHRFVDRNATVAAFSDALLVVEAPDKSGSLITANLAAEMGKPVFVVPASITQLSFNGSHRLIRDGAQLVFFPDQILEEMAWLGPSSPRGGVGLTPTQSQILECLGPEPISADQIRSRAGMDQAELLIELTTLEAIGVIIREGPGFIIKP